ncbi:MAG: HIT family protein [Candidatus Nanoarchaeia archaeon]
MKGELPCTKVYEDDHVFAFLDIAPIAPGHTLVVPKNHSKDIYDIPAEDLHHVSEGIQKVSRAVKAALGCDGINVGMNNEAAAGQAVWHAHWHVVPRYSDDGLSHWPRGKYEEGKDKETAEKIQVQF